MTIKRHPFALSVALGVAALAIPVIAQETGTTSVAFQKSEGSLERIAISRKLRMLSQSIPAAACHLAAQIDPDASKEKLTLDALEFDKILAALELGDSDYNINTAEPRTKTRAKIEGLRATWASVKAAAVDIAAEPSNSESLQIILDQNLAVLDEASDLVVELTGQYSNPVEMVQADAFLIDILGRQRMLTQQMSKDACAMSTNPTAQTAEALKASMGVFEASLQALMNGMPGAGIKKPPTAEISDALEMVAMSWGEVKPLLMANLDGQDVDGQHQTKIFRGLNATVPKLEKVLDLYEKTMLKAS